MSCPIVIVQDQLRNGGTERQSLLLAATLRERGEDVRMLVFSPGGRLEGEPEQRGIPVQVLQRRNYGLPLWAPGLQRSLQALQPRAVLCMGRTANCYAGWLQERFPAVPVIGSLRTGKAILPMQRASWRKVSVLFVNCEWWKARLIEFGVEPDRIHVHPNPLVRQPPEPEAQRELRKRLRAERGIGETTRVLLNVASFRKGKRQLQLIEQVAWWARQHPDADWQLWLVGEGRCKAACARRIRALGLEGRIWLTGYRHHVNSFYAAADIAVSYSVEDALPNFLIEAQANGLPVLALDYRGVAECVQQGRSGWVVSPEKDGRAFRAKLQEMVAAPLQCQAMGRSGARFAQSRFNPRERLDAWIADLMDRANRCRFA